MKIMPKEIEAQAVGLRRALAHAEHLHRQGILSNDEIDAARTYALEQRFGPLMSTEEYVAARQSGDFEKYETLMNDSRTPSSAAREAAMRKAAAHFVADQAIAYQPKDQADHDRVMRETRDHMGKFIDLSGADPDPDFAVWETKTKIDLGDEVSKPKEPPPSWSLPAQRISDDDAHARDFRLRNESTPGTRAHGKTHDIYGTKRDARGRIISERTLREDADKPKKPTGSERGDGMVVDDWGVMTAAEGAERDRFEQSQREANDAAAQAAAEPAPAPVEVPVTLPSPGES